MKKEIRKRPKLELNNETKKLEKVGEEEFIMLIPDEGKCLMNKKTGHKFIHTIRGTGLAIPATEETLDVYEEVDIK